MAVRKGRGSLHDHPLEGLDLSISLSLLCGLLALEFLQPAQLAHVRVVDPWRWDRSWGDRSDRVLITPRARSELRRPQGLSFLGCESRMGLGPRVMHLWVPGGRSAVR